MSSAADQAYAIIRERISDGSLAPGERLKEADVVRMCDVSRTPVREALRRLAHDGLVRIVPNSGAVVAGWEPDDLADLFAARAELEAMACARAAERASQRDLEIIRNRADAMETYAASERDAPNGDELTRLNSAFHNAVLDAAHSRPLVMALSQVIEAPLMLRTFERFDAERLRRSLSHHREIVAAIKARDPEWAGAIMRTHILAGFRALTSDGAARALPRGGRKS